MGHRGGNYERYSQRRQTRGGSGGLGSTYGEYELSGVKASRRFCFPAQGRNKLATRTGVRPSHLRGRGRVSCLLTDAAASALLRTLPGAGLEPAVPAPHKGRRRATTGGLVYCTRSLPLEVGHTPECSVEPGEEGALFPKDA
ncbi:hypothetical protein NDU88_010943 [Pleurodeles waltl]|uniref:Uncharacterized protein n=1 Tax=Pleurodeles waltl TaxID=8319 RepID=A0AAV7S233_PLEWA|nr:hypothetical protein NDU88_010943 [Pleurodeles waltl]